MQRGIEVNNLTIVAEDILDGAISQHFASNVETLESVQAYAENVCEITLSDDEAEKVRKVCMAWVNGVASGRLNGTDDHYKTVIEPLTRND